VKEVIDEILAAEREAAERIKVAEENAREILAGLSYEIDRIRKDYEISIAAETEKVLAYAAAAAEKRYKESIRDYEAQASALTKSAERNIAAAAEIVSAGFRKID
jgi:vacuolar-type H+-ATPase subunit H